MPGEVVAGSIDGPGGPVVAGIAVVLILDVVPGGKLAGTTAVLKGVDIGVGDVFRLG